MAEKLPLIEREVLGLGLDTSFYIPINDADTTDLAGLLPAAEALAVCHVRDETRQYEGSQLFITGGVARSYKTEGDQTWRTAHRDVDLVVVNSDFGPLEMQVAAFKEAKERFEQGFEQIRSQFDEDRKKLEEVADGEKDLLRTLITNFSENRSNYVAHLTLAGIPFHFKYESAGVPTEGYGGFADILYRVPDLRTDQSKVPLDVTFYQDIRNDLVE